jgi:hypothetical protein
VIVVDWVAIALMTREKRLARSCGHLVQILVT